MRARIEGLWLALATAMLVASCGGDDHTSLRRAIEPGARSPSALLTRFADAMDAANGDVAVACIDVSNADSRAYADLIRRVASALREHREIGAEINKKFGSATRTALEEELRPELAGMEGPYRDLKVTATRTVDPMEGHAVPGGLGPARMVRKGDAWVLDAKDVLPASDRAFVTQALDAYARLLDQTRRALESARTAEDFLRGME